MQITNDLSGNLSASSVRSAERATAETFADVFNKVVTTADKAKTAKVEKSASQIQREKEEAIQVAYKAVVAELNDYVNKSPAEHMRDAVLKELGLTEADLDAMPPEKRMAMEAIINERVREKLLGRKPAPEEGAASAELLEPAATKNNSEMINSILASLSASGLAMGQTKVS